MIENNILKIVDDSTLEIIDNTSFYNEKYLQMITIKNIEKISNLQVVDYEFNPGYGNNRFDCVLFNPKKKVFIIVEFKNKKDTRVTDQIFNYLDDILIYPHKLINTYNNKYHKNFDEKYFNLSKTEVLIIGTEFIQRQCRAFISLYKELGDRFNVIYAKNIENKYIIFTDFFSTLKETNIKSYINTKLNESTYEYNNTSLSLNTKTEKYFRAPNILLNSKININSNSCRILYYLLYSGYNSKTNYLIKEFNIHILEIDNFYNLNNNLYASIHSSIKALRNVVLNNLTQGENMFNEFKIFDSISYSFGVINVSFSDEFINSYNDVTMINLNNMIKFTCKYSFRLYHLIIKELVNNKHSNINIELAYFRSLFDIENKYTSNANIKIKTLNPSFEDFKNNNDNLNFKFIGIEKINNIYNIKIKAII